MYLDSAADAELVIEVPASKVDEKYYDGVLRDANSFSQVTSAKILKRTSVLRVQANFGQLKGRALANAEGVLHAKLERMVGIYTDLTTEAEKRKVNLPR